MNQKIDKKWIKNALLYYNDSAKHEAWINEQNTNINNLSLLQKKILEELNKK